ncbi:MAG: OmpH family outer membrane protein [Planctomycetes bacterium]|nr:OmpH family outer membrane protein [Planctomycetota bacterium]
MNRFTLTVAAALLAVVPVFAQTDVNPKPGGDPAPKGPPPALKLAIVDLSAVFDKWVKVKEFTDGLEVQKKAQEAELEAMKKTLQEKVQIRDTPGINPKIRQSAQLDIVQLQAKADYMMKMWNEQVKQLLDEGIAKYYDEIQAEVAAYAKENGYTLVLKMETGLLGTAEDKSHSDEKIARRIILYADPGFDITADILGRLDAKYAKEKAAGPK